jgi:hypothetical protein
VASAADRGGITPMFQIDLVGGRPGSLGDLRRQTPIRRYLGRSSVGRRRHWRMCGRWRAGQRTGASGGMVRRVLSVRGLPVPVIRAWEVRGARSRSDRSINGLLKGKSYDSVRTINRHRDNGDLSCKSGRSESGVVALAQTEGLEMQMM